VKSIANASFYQGIISVSDSDNYFLQLKKQSLSSVLLIALLFCMAPIAWAHTVNVDQPNLISPVKNAPAYPELSPTFQWTMGTSSVSSLVYDIYLGTNASQLRLIAENFTDNSYNDSSILYFSNDTVNLLYFYQLNKNTTYYWKVVAKDNAGGSAASEVWAFTTGSPNLFAPAPPINPYPVNNSVNAAITPMLVWQESTDADGDQPVYDVYLSVNPSPTTLVAADLSSPSFQVNTPLKGNTTYFWKVVARDPGGLETSGSIWKFTTQNNAPAAPTLLLPPHQATNVAYNTTLTWQKALDPDGDSITYEVWYGTGATPDRLLVTGNTSMQLTLAANTGYSWKIVSIDSRGARTESAVWTFTTSPNAGNTAPAAPTLSAPANTSTGVLFQQSLQWSASTDNDHDAIYYTVYMGTDGINLAPVASLLTTTSYSPALQAGKKYYWKVAAFDNKGGVTESDTWQFTTTTQDVGITNLRVYYRYADLTDLYNFESAALSPVFNEAIPAYITRGRTTVKDAIAIVLDYTEPNTVVSFDLPPSFTGTTNIIYNKGLPTGATKYYQIEGIFATHNTITVHLQNGTITRSYTIDVQVNQKPTLPVLQTPANGAANVPVLPTYTWTGGDDADGNTLMYRLYLGTSTANFNVSGIMLNNKSFTPAVPLAGAQKYYWKIRATDPDNEYVESDVHSFVTQSIPLTAPLLQYPREISTYVETDVTLAWKYENAPGITYDIYLDKNSTPQRIAQGVTGTTYTIQNLAPATTYYWKVVAINQQGVTISSKTGQFITKPANGNETGTFTDIRDGEIYQWVLINGLKWMTHNLAYQPQPKDGYYDYQYFNTSANAKSFVPLNNNSQNISKYGYLYNWEAAMNFDNETDTGARKQGVCPCGWRVATIADWQSMTPLNANFTAIVHHSTWTIPGKENEWLNTNGLSLLPSGFYNAQAFPMAFQTNSTQFWLAQNDRLESREAGYTWNAQQNKLMPNGNNALGHASVRCVNNNNNNHAPGKPVLQSPLNNSTLTNFNQQLQWAAVTDVDGDAITYDLYVDTLPDPAQRIQTGFTGASFQLTELQQNKTYYWKIRARDSHGEATDSDVWQFTLPANNNTPPGAVQLVSPANGSSGINTPLVNLGWTAATDANGDAVTYNLYAGKLPATLSLVATNLTGTTYTLNNANNSTTYYWKVVAIDGHGGVAESALNNFTTLNHAPSAPVLLSPSNGAQGIKQTQLIWAPATDADGDRVYYRFLWGTDPTALNAAEITETTINFGGNAVLTNTIYYWQIIATDRKGGETASELRQFKTYRNEFSNPGILPVNPANSGTNVSLTPSLSWTKPLNNVVYDVYVSMAENSRLALVAENISDTPFVLNQANGVALQPHFPYLWKVVPKDAFGNIYDSPDWLFTTRNSVPTKPVLTLPVHGATGQPYAVTLNWSPSGDTDGDLLLYDVYLGADPNPTTLFAGDLRQTTYTTSQLSPNTTYYWKIAVKDGFGGTITSDVFSFTIQNNSVNTAPEAPQLISPLAYESGVGSAVTLQWNAAFDIDGDALLYDVYLGTNPVMLSPVATGVSSLQYSPGSLINGVTYYWKVVARDGKGGETASPVWTFTAKNNAPTAPVLLTPVTNDILTGTNTVLTWAAAQDADNDAIVYDVYLDKNPQPVTLLAKGLTTLSYNTPAVDNNGVYYWKVIARDALGAETASTVFTFIGRNQAPSAPILQSPANTSTTTTAAVTLAWNASTDMDSDPPAYSVYIGTSLAALQKTATVYSTSFTTRALTANTTWYWKVVARDQQQATAESAVWTFTFQPPLPNQPPAAPQLLTPANQSTAVSIQQTAFSWAVATDPENDPVKYDLYVSIDAQAGTKIATDLVATSYSLTSLTANSTYYWKVVAKDDHGNSDTSSTWQFTAVNTQPVTYTISGRITNASGDGIPFVTLQGLPLVVITNASGNYTATVPAGWSGTITPALAGHEFEPKQRTVSNIQADMSAQHFTGKTITATNDPVLDAAIQISPNPTSGPIVITLPELLHSWKVELFNTSGYKLNNRTVNGFTRKLELFLPGKGIFFIRFTNNNKTVVRKVVVL
jgi:uncharacterized protein (TIGR02145 family)